MDHSHAEILYNLAHRIAGTYEVGLELGNVHFCIPDLNIITCVVSFMQLISSMTVSAFLKQSVPLIFWRMSGQKGPSSLSKALQSWVDGCSVEGLTESSTSLQLNLLRAFTASLQNLGSQVFVLSIWVDDLKLELLMVLLVVVSSSS